MEASVRWAREEPFPSPQSSPRTPETIQTPHVEAAQAIQRLIYVRDEVAPAREKLISARRTNEALGEVSRRRPRPTSASEVRQPPNASMGAFAPPYMPNSAEQDGFRPKPIYSSPSSGGRMGRGHMRAMPTLGAKRLAKEPSLNSTNSTRLEPEPKEPEKTQEQRVEFVKALRIRVAQEKLAETQRREEQAQRWRRTQLKVQGPVMGRSNELAQSMWALACSGLFALVVLLVLGPMADPRPEGSCGRLLNQKEAIAVDEELMASPGFSVDQLMEATRLPAACQCASAALSQMRRQGSCGSEDALWTQLRDLEQIRLRVDYAVRTTRVKAASLLCAGSALGLLGFVIAGGMGLGKAFLADKEVNVRGENFASGHNYYPSTVSEMVRDRESPMGKCFYGFTSAGSFAIWMSWYPWHLQNEDSVWCCSVMTLRTLVPPISMLLVSVITVVPFREADSIEAVSTVIHAMAATLAMGGYCVLEWYTLNVAKNVRMTQRERHLRQLINLLLGFCTFGLVVTGVVAQHPEQFGICCGDLYIVPNVTDIVASYNRGAYQQGTRNEFLVQHHKVGLVDTASGAALAFKLGMFWFEVSAGLLMLASHFIIFLYCPERGYLDGQLSQRSEASSDGEEDFDPDDAEVVSNGSAQASRLLSSLRCGSQWRVALVIFGGLPAANIARSPGIYSALMSVLASRHLWQDSLALLRDAELEGSNLEAATPTLLTSFLDAAVYNSAITTCARASRWQWSLWLLAYLRGAADSGRTVRTPAPNAISYNAAIHACERRGLWEQALCLLESLSRDLQVRSSSLNVAMSACEKGQQWQATLLLLSRFSHFGCDRTLVTYGAAVAACAVSQSWETALEVLSEMHLMGVFPSKEMLNSLLDVCKRSWAWQQGLEVFLESRDGLGLGSFRQRKALCQAVETSQALSWAQTLALRPLSLLELRRATLSDQRFVWQSSRPVHVASAEWLDLANIFAADSIRQSLEQRNGFGRLSVACAVAAAFPLEKYPEKPQVLLVCGPGNNGGDGLVAARHLHHFGYSPRVVYPKPNQKEQLFVNLVTQLSQLSVPVDTTLPESLEGYCCVVDAIFGFSFRGAVRAPFDDVLRRLAAPGAPPVLSVDIPSGWDVEKGPPAEGVCLQPSAPFLALQLCLSS
eukprot:s2194_g9.t3